MDASGHPTGLVFAAIVAQGASVKRHNVTLSEPVSEMVTAQVKIGRYKDFSAALQDAAWNYFFGPPSPFDEYGVTPEEMERAYQKTVREIDQERKAGKLKPWKK